MNTSYLRTQVRKSTCRATEGIPLVNCKLHNDLDLFPSLDQQENAWREICLQCDTNPPASFENRFYNHSVQEGLKQHDTSSKSETGRSSQTLHSSMSSLFEGKTAMYSQLENAQELLQKAVFSDPLINKNTAIGTALISLNDIFSKTRQQACTSDDKHPFPKTTCPRCSTGAKLERPPWEAVLEVLEKTTSFPSVWLAIEFPFLSFDLLKGIIQKAYHSPEECPAIRRVLMYGVLYNRFSEFAYYRLSDATKQEPLRTYTNQCKRQLELAISQLDMNISPTFESTVALLLAAFFAVESGQSCLCWVMNSQAAALCQRLGYHRICTMTDDDEITRKSKINIFWSVYVLDKTLSLRLGHASSIQDWDISLPFFPGNLRLTDKNTVGKVTKGQAIIVYAIRIAQIQGQLYEKLFSPAALSKSERERSIIAKQLLNALDQAWIDRANISVLDLAAESPVVLESKQKLAIIQLLSIAGTKRRKKHSFSFFYPEEPWDNAASNLEKNQAPLGNVMLRGLNTIDELQHLADLYHHRDAVVHHATCTLIQRATSYDSMTSSTPCLASARKALAAHQRCSDKFNVDGVDQLWRGYLQCVIISLLLHGQWAYIGITRSIFQAPFTPFIVIFWNTILTCDTSDLSILSNLVNSLDKDRQNFKDLNQSYSILALLLHIARLYIDAKQKETPQMADKISSSTGRFISKLPEPSTPSTTLSREWAERNTHTHFDHYSKVSRQVYTQNLEPAWLTVAEESIMLPSPQSMSTNEADLSIRDQSDVPLNLDIASPMGANASNMFGMNGSTAFISPMSEWSEWFSTNGYFPSRVQQG